MPGVLLLTGLRLSAGSFFDSGWNVPWGDEGANQAAVTANENDRVAYAVILNPGPIVLGANTIVTGVGLGSIFDSPLDPLPPLGTGGSGAVIGSSPDGGVGYAIALNTRPLFTGSTTTVVIGNPVSGTQGGLGYGASFSPNQPASGNAPVGSAAAGQAVPDQPPAAPPARPARASAAVLNGQLSTVALADGGAGYVRPPSVLVVGGGGFGARVEAKLTAGKVTGFVVTDPGLGYTHCPNVFIASPTTEPAVGIAIAGTGWISLPQSLVPGRNYRLLTSPDMKTWTPVDAPFTAASDLISAELVTTRRAQYFRLEEIP